MRRKDINGRSLSFTLESSCFRTAGEVIKGVAQTSDEGLTSFVKEPSAETAFEVSGTSDDSGAGLELDLAS